MDLSKEIESCLEKLKKIQENNDTEVAHIDADECIIEFLKGIGFGDIAVEYDMIDKWYA